MTSAKSAVFKQLKKHNPLKILTKAVLRFQNQQRQKSHPTLGYILMQLPADMPSLPESRSFVRRQVFGEPPLSLWELERRFRRIAADPRPQGVILSLSGFALSLADLQTLRQSIQRLRDAGKKVVCYAQNYDLATYYVASAGDEILIQPGGNIFAVGLRQEVVFFKDALAQLGVSVDSIAISPYKGAADSLTRSDISPEAREQLEWLLDSRYTQIVEGIAAGRGFSVEKTQEIINTAPHLDTFAHGITLVDGIRYEEELYTYLGTQDIITWEEAEQKLLVTLRTEHQKYVALLPVEGLMIPGESGNTPNNVPTPFVEVTRAGDITITRQVRALMQADDVAAVVLYVDSGGGAAIAAEAMYAALLELGQKVPLVVYMNGVAASGGYLISSAGRHIVAQAGTTTGSIGVILSKPVAGGLRDKLNIRAVEFLRGKNADILSTSKPFSDGQRVWLTESIQRSYDIFLEHVARGRKMEKSAVDAVGGGRVWTGEQALKHGLVDELGGLQLAIQRACEFANLPTDAPVALVTGKTKPIVPQIAERVNPAATLQDWQQTVQAVSNGQPQLLMPIHLRRGL